MDARSSKFEERKKMIPAWLVKDGNLTVLVQAVLTLGGGCDCFNWAEI